jgi:hypothetical protein
MQKKLMYNEFLSICLLFLVPLPKPTLDPPDIMKDIRQI